MSGGAPAGSHPRHGDMAAVVGGVVAAAVRAAAARGVVVLDDGSAEARLALEWCALGLSSGAVHGVASARLGDVESALQSALADGHDGGAASTAEAARQEAHRAAARIAAARRGALLAAPLNKTALLLAPMPIPEPLLPLGDVWGHQVEAMTGSWSAPAAVRRLAERAGGVRALDEALMRWCEGREPLAVALAGLAPAVAEDVHQAVDRGRLARRYAGLVPKLTSRTVGVDLFA